MLHRLEQLDATGRIENRHRLSLLLRLVNQHRDLSRNVLAPQRTASRSASDSTRCASRDRK
jgi:hypothetical protein